MIPFKNRCQFVLITCIVAFNDFLTRKERFIYSYMFHICAEVA